MKEIWRPIKEYRGFYEVSSLGRVRSFYGKRVHLIPPKYSHGYMYLQLWKNGKYKNARVNRLVAKAFVSNPLNKEQVNHKNLNKQDNKASNLEWCTASENKRHAIKNGITFAKPQLGEKHGMAVLTEKIVKEIRRKSRSISSSLLARKYKVSHSAIRRVINRVTWKHI